MHRNLRFFEEEEETKINFCKTNKTLVNLDDPNVVNKI